LPMAKPLMKIKRLLSNLIAELFNLFVSHSIMPGEN
jgi:hypothetical protein